MTTRAFGKEKGLRNNVSTCKLSRHSIVTPVLVGSASFMKREASLANICCDEEGGRCADPSAGCSPGPPPPKRQTQDFCSEKNPKTAKGGKLEGSPWGQDHFSEGCFWSVVLPGWQPLVVTACEGCVLSPVRLSPRNELLVSCFGKKTNNACSGRENAFSALCSFTKVLGHERGRNHYVHTAYPHVALETGGGSPVRKSVTITSIWTPGTLAAYVTAVPKGWYRSVTAAARGGFSVSKAAL